MPENPSPITHVQTIPADFYGGVNPVVKFKKVEKEVVLESKPTLTESEKKMLDSSTAAGSGQPLHAVNIFTNRKFLFIFWPALFLVIVAGAGGYYYLQIRSQRSAQIPPGPQITVPTSTPQTTTPIVEVPDVTTSTTDTQKPLAEAPIEFPSNLLGDTADLDKDSISDMAEALFGTDASKPDTDEDSYADGHEVFYLYNPAGKEPMRLIESGFVKEYQNPTFGYKLFYPNDWAVGAVDDSSRDVLFSTLTGENIEVRTFDLLPDQTFGDWFTRWAPNENFQNLKDFQTKFVEPGKSRADNLVYYFTDNNHVYVLVYHTTDSNAVNFRSVLVMMARSFRSVGHIPPEVIPAPSASDNFPDEMPPSMDSSS